MTSINAGGAFYRVQNSLNQNSEEVSKSMQRLASGSQNTAPGDRTASTAVAFGMKGELASLKIGVQNATEALQVMERANNDIGKRSNRFKLRRIDINHHQSHS
jgi:flagellin-like hook-associated protein FlgL